MNTAPLAGVVVVDLSTTFMGPYCSLLLAQLGARVIKVETPDGDIVRYIGDTRDHAMGPIFLNANRGKESVVLDLKRTADREVLDRLVERCDVFLHNLRPAAAERLDIGAARVLDQNPRVVYCHTVGFGGGGPYRDKPAYDDVVQAVSGLAAVQGVGSEPAYVRTPVADKVVGLMAFGAIVGALYARERTGRGQAIEIPMFENMAAFVLLEQQGGLVYADAPGPAGYARTASPYRRPHATADGHIGLMLYTDAHWRAFFELVGRPDLAGDERFWSIRGRTEHIDELYELVEQCLATRSTEEWLTLFDERHIPAMPVRGVEDLLDDPHLVSVGLFERVAHPSEGTLVQPRLPWTFSDASLPSAAPAPRLGEHTEAVLAWLEATGDRTDPR